MNQKKESKFMQLATLDIFGFQPKLYINNQENYKTVWGFFLTFLLFGCVIVACWVYGKDMIYKENPTTIITEQITQHPERFDMKRDTFNFAVGLQGSDWAHYIDESVYVAEFVQEVRKQVMENGKKVTKKENKVIKSRPCTYNDFGVDKQFFNEFSETTSLICPDNYDDIYIEGDFGADVYSTIVMRFSYCQESDEYIEGVSTKKCKDINDIKEILEENYFAIYFTDQILNPKDYQNPFQSTGRSLFTILNSGQQKTQTYYFQNQYIEDNTGIIFDDISIQKNISYSYENQEIRNYVPDNGNFLKVNLRMEKVKEKKIYRNYLNIASVIAQVGGILKVLTVGFFLVSKIVSTQQYYINMANSVFSFDIKDSKNTEGNSQKVIKQKSFFQLLFPCCLNKQNKNEKKYLDFAVQKLRQKLDINYILNKLVEIEKIKMLLMDTQQRKLFEYQAKPVISEEIINNIPITQQVKKLEKSLKLNDQKETQNNLKILTKYQSSTLIKTQQDLEQQQDFYQNLFLLNEDQSQESKNQDAFKAYISINKKSKKKQIDDKIIALMDKDIHEQFLQQFEEHQNINQKYTNNLDIEGKNYSNFKNEKNALQLNTPQKQQNQQQQNIQKQIMIEQIQQQNYYGSQNNDNEIQIILPRSEDHSILSQKTINSENQTVRYKNNMVSSQVPNFFQKEIQNNDVKINIQKIQDSQRQINSSRNKEEI